MTVYNWLKTKRPKSNIIKQRSEGDLETVYGPTLEICYLNRTASRIMKLSDGKNTVDDIKRKLYDSSTKIKELINKNQYNFTNKIKSINNKCSFFVDIL